MATGQDLDSRSRADAADLNRRVCELYVDRGNSTYAIAIALNIDRQRVARLLHRAGVKLSPRGAGRLRPGRRVQLSSTSSEALRDLYIRDRRTTSEIAALFTISTTTVQRLLREQGIRLRTRGWKNREDRIEPPVDVVEKLYYHDELSADEVGKQLGCSRQIVLRMIHDMGWPVRVGGPLPSDGPEDIELICALYADRRVAATLRRYGVPRVEPGGPVWQRFPVPLEVTAAAVRDLYVRCGLSMRHVELLTGHPAMTIASRLRETGVELRPPGGRSPFIRRWRAGVSNRKASRPKVVSADIGLK